MLLKCCTQYASKFGKLSSGRRTEKGQFSFQSWREMPKNVQPTIQMHLLPMLARLCLKSFRLGFSSMWTKSFWVYKLGFEEAEEPEIKLPTSKSKKVQNCQHPNTRKRKRVPEKTSISALLTMPKPLTVWIIINCGKFWKRWEYQTTWPASWETYMQARKQQLELDMEQPTSSK